MHSHCQGKATSNVPKKLNFVNYLAAPGRFLPVLLWRQQFWAPQLHQAETRLYFFIYLYIHIEPFLFKVPRAHKQMPGPLINTAKMNSLPADKHTDKWRCFLTQSKSLRQPAVKSVVKRDGKNSCLLHRIHFPPSYLFCRPFSLDWCASASKIS